MYILLKVYLTIALVTLSIITSIGIYGLLSTGFQENIAKMEIGGKQIQNIEVKKQRFEEIKTDLEKEKITLDKDSNNLVASTNIPVSQCKNKTIILVDDVLNSGRTLLYGLSVFLNIPTKKIKVVFSLTFSFLW
mgnify:CR=1 FL=1